MSAASDQSPAARDLPNARSPADPVPNVLVCFAVKEEAQPFRELAGSRPHVQTLLTGIGPRNTEQAIRANLGAQKPRLVLSCGFAGGLRPELAAGTVLFAVDAETGLESALLAAGARKGRFHCLPRVAATAEQKRALCQNTGADAVEMESQIICNVCREQNIPSGIVRVILDPADEDLPLDFNDLMTPEQQMDYGKLALKLMKSPRKAGALLQFGRQARVAAEKLAQVLATITAPSP